MNAKTFQFIAKAQAEAERKAKGEVEEDEALLEAKRKARAARAARAPPRRLMPGITPRLTGHTCTQYYLSRAAALLASTPLAIADEATWRGLVARCPRLGRARRWLRIGAAWRQRIMANSHRVVN